MDSVNILTIGDPHLQLRYIKVVDEFIKQTLEVIEAKRPDIVVILGDTLHTHESTNVECHKRACDWFVSIAAICPVIVLIGNHDLKNNTQFLSDSHFFHCMENTKNVTIVSKAYSMDVSKGGNSYRFVCLPYVPPGRFREALNTLKTPIEEKTPHAIFAHQEIKGCKMGAIVSEHGDEWPLDAPGIISGHIHEFQLHQPNVNYVGTPYQTTYSEDGSTKGIYMFSFIPGSKLLPKPIRIKLKLRVKQSIQVTPKEFSSPAFKMPDTAIDLRIVIKGPQSEVEGCKQLKIYRELSAMPNVKIVLQPELDLVAIGVVLPPQQSFMKSLYTDVSADEELRKLFVEVLGDIQ